MKKLFATSLMLVLSVVISADARTFAQNQKLQNVGDLIPVQENIGAWQLYQCNTGAVAQYIELPPQQLGYPITGKVVAQLTTSTSPSSAVVGALVKFDEPNPNHSQFNFLQIHVKGEKADLHQMWLNFCFKDNRNNAFAYRTPLSSFFLQQAAGGWYTSYLMKEKIPNAIVRSGNAVLSSISFTRIHPSARPVLLGEIMVEVGEEHDKQRGYARTLIMDKGDCPLGAACPN